MIWPRFALWLLTEELPQFTRRAASTAALAEVAVLYREWCESGKNPNCERWIEVRKNAAYADAAASAAAYAAAYATSTSAAAAAAADAAADAAAYAANATSTNATYHEALIAQLDLMLDAWEEAVTKEGEDLYIPREWEEDALKFVADMMLERSDADEMMNK
jgi:hypothetical protein